MTQQGLILQNNFYDVNDPFRFLRSGIGMIMLRSSKGRSISYFLKRTCPDTPAGVLKVTLIVAPSGIICLAFPIKAFCPEDERITISRSAPVEIKADAVKPSVGRTLLPPSKKRMIMVVSEAKSSAWTAATSTIRPPFGPFWLPCACWATTGVDIASAIIKRADLTQAKCRHRFVSSRLGRGRPPTLARAAAAKTTFTLVSLSAYSKE
jgi:hypothetical protein